MRLQPCFPDTRFRHVRRRARRLWLAPALAAVLLMLATWPARAAWPPNGVPISPLPGASESTSLCGLAPDGSNGAYVVWEFRAPLPEGEQVVWRAQRVAVDGNRPAPWPADGTVIRSWSTYSSFGTIALFPVGLYPDGAGGAVLAILDQTFIVEPMTLFRLHHIAPDGAAAAIDIANTVFGGYPVRMADADGDGAGGVVMVALQQTFAPPPNPPSPGMLFAARIDATGQPLWPAGSPDVVELNTTGETGLGGVAALSDGAGGGFFAWTDLREPGDPDLYVQHLDAAGAIAPGWPAGGVRVCGAAGSQTAPRLASDGAGGVLVVWTDARSGVPRLHGGVVRADGTLGPGVPADGAQLPSGDVEDTFLDLESDKQGGCFVGRAGSTPGSTAITHLHRLGATMQARPDWPATGIALNEVAPFPRIFALAADGAGGVYVSFMDGSGGNPPVGLAAQRFGPDGAPAPGWTASGYLLSATGYESAIVRSGGGAIVAWNDLRTPDHGVYAQRLVTDGPVAAQLALVSAAVVDRRVALRWYSADGPWLRATLERSTAGSGWALLAEITADGEGTLVYEDAAVTPGVRYGYRLMWRDGDVTRLGGEAWVAVPRTNALAIEAPGPNPATGAVTLAVTLPAARGARLDVFDLAGRRVAGRALDALGAGRHVVTLDEVAALAAGIYVIQVTQAGEVRRTRLVRME